MQSLLDGRITVSRYENMLAYTLQDDISSSVDYKVMLNKNSSPFLKCMKILDNGKVEFLFVPGVQIPLDKIVKQIIPASFHVIIKNIIGGITGIKSNGFLDWKRIDFAVDRIFIDPHTLEAYLVYLPITEKLFDDDSGFENTVRSCLIRLIEDNALLYSRELEEIKNRLFDGRYSLENILTNAIPGAFPTPMPEPAPDPVPGPAPTPGPDPVPASSRLTLIPLKEGCQAISVTDGYHVVGRSGEFADILLPNNTVGRKHCSIEKNEGAYYITDLNSKNGVFLNGKKIEPDKKILLSEGDELKITIFKFRVKLS